MSELFCMHDNIYFLMYNCNSEFELWLILCKNIADLKMPRIRNRTIIRALQLRLMYVLQQT